MARQTKDKNYKYMVYVNPYEFYDQMNAQKEKNPKFRPTYNEILLEGRPLKMMIDLDIVGDYDEEQGVKMLECVLNAIADVFQSYGAEIEPRNDIVLLSNHREGKLSYHIIIAHFCFANNKVLAWLYERLRQLIEDETILQYVDHGIYAPNHLFRMYDNYKVGTDRALKFEKEFRFRGELHESALEDDLEIFLASLVQWTLEDCKFIKVDVPETTTTGAEESSYGGTRSIDKHDVKSVLKRWRKKFNKDEAFEPGDQIEEERFLNLKRLQPSECPICDRVHENDGQYIVFQNNRAILRCRRNKDRDAYVVIFEKEGLVREQPPYRRPTDDPDWSYIMKGESGFAKLFMREMEGRFFSTDVEKEEGWYAPPEENKWQQVGLKRMAHLVRKVLEPVVSEFFRKHRHFLGAYKENGVDEKILRCVEKAKPETDLTTRRFRMAVASDIFGEAYDPKFLNRLNTQNHMASVRDKQGKLLVVMLNQKIKEGSNPRPIRLDDYFSMEFEGIWDPKADPTRWNKFIDDFTLSDEAFAKELQRVSGYFISGDNTMRWFFEMISGGCSGKSLYVKMMARVLGEFFLPATPGIYVVPRGSKPSSSDGPKPHLQQMKWRRLTAYMEVAKGDVMNTAVVKEVTGSDDTNNRGLREANKVQRDPTCKILGGGQYAAIKDPNDGAVGDRWYPFAIKVKFVSNPKEGSDERKIDKKLIDEMPKCQNDVSACLNWLIKGAYRFYKTKDEWEKPAWSLAMIEEGEQEADLFQAFLDECADTKETADEMVQSSVLAEEYRQVAAREATSERTRSAQNGQASHGQETIRRTAEEKWWAEVLSRASVVEQGGEGEERQGEEEIGQESQEGSWERAGGEVENLIK